MFSSPGSTRPSAAAARTTTGTGAFGLDGAGSGNSPKKSKRNPFDSDESDRGNASHRHKNGGSGDGAAQKQKRGRAETRGQDGNKRSRRRQGPRKSLPPDGASQEELQQSAESDDDVSPPPSTSAGGSRLPPAESDDPLSKRIYERLQADGIRPPRWPLDPGNLEQQHEMARFRDLYEAYRRKVRASLTKAGLIDDPEKRKRLSDAIEFKGICEDMCPEFEKITRITENDVNRPEKDAFTGVPRVRLMVKKLARSAAGQEAPLPMDVRSAPALRRTLDYLIDEVLINDGNLGVMHPFLWDRTRAIRRDFAFFSSLSEEEVKTQVYVLENITRFHVTSLHLLSHRDKEDDSFVEQQELEQLGKTLLSLRDVYDDCNNQGIVCENEVEFRAYYLLFHGRDPGILETLQRQWKADLWQGSDAVRTAGSLVEALQNTADFLGGRKDGESGPLLAATTDRISYFRIVQDPSVTYTMACFAECHFPHVRRTILAAVKRALARPKDPVRDVTAAALNQYLQFDTVEQAVQFAQLHGFTFAPDQEDPSDVGRQFLMLNDRSSLPHVRLNHQFSREIVERKRGLATLPDVIHSTVSQSTPGTDVWNESQSETLTSSTAPAGSVDATGASKGAEASTSAASNPYRKPRVTNGFIIDSDTEDDSSDGAATPQPQPPQGHHSPAPVDSANIFITEGNRQAPSRLPTFEEIKAMDSSNFLGDTPRTMFSLNGTNGIEAASGDPQPARANPFAQPPNPPQEGHGLSNSQVTKPNPFATAPRPGNSVRPATESRASAKPSPFSQAAPFGSSARPFGQTETGNPANPNPFGSPFQTGGSRETTGETQPVKPNPFAPAPSSGGGGSAVTPATNPSRSSEASSTGKLVDTAAPAVTAPSAFTAARPAFGSGRDSQDDSTRVPSPRVATSDLHDGQPSPGSSAATSSHPFGTSVTGTLGQANPPPASTGGLPLKPNAAFPTQESGAPTTGEQPAGFSAPGLPPQAAASPQGASGHVSNEAAGFSGTTALAPTPVTAAGPAVPRRDLLGDINKWYVKGDNGLLSDFVVESVRQITEAAFLQYQNEVEEQKRREEEERTNAEVERFRVYNISLKFFYRWKRNARAKRLQTVRLQAREQMRAYLAEQRAAARKARQAEKEAAAQAEKQRLAYEARESEDAFIARMDAKCAASREARASLMADEAMSRRDRELEAARKKAGGGSASSALSQSSGRSQPAGQPQQPARKEGPKTRALRQLLDGKPQGFRRSLPSLSSNRESPSNASPRWRLKAMGIVPLPDGTAVPESLARDMTFGRPHFTRSVESYRARRISATEAIETGLRRARSSSLQESGETGPLNKRKRSPGEESGEREGAAAEADAASKRTTSSADKRPRHGEDKDGADSGGSKPDESDYEKLLRTSRQFRMELRAFDAEMKEDTEWFRAENERMRSESAGRTAWYDDSI